MHRFLVINGPNLNNLGKRDAGLYGSITLGEIEDRVKAVASDLCVDVDFFQSNHEGAIVDWIQAESGNASGIIINAGALTQVGYSILDALLDAKLPVVEVHMSNIHGREEFRRHSSDRSLRFGANRRPRLEGIHVRAGQPRKAP